MNDINIGQEVVKKIKAENLKPKPRWSFLLKNYVFWSFFVISLIVGSLAMAVIIFMIRINDWDLCERLTGSLLSLIIFTLPYFWLLVLTVFIFIAYYYLRHTKTGYRYSLVMIVAITIGTSAVLGVIAHSAGLGKIIAEAMSERIPMYGNLEFNRAKMWIQPERGLLAGTIIDMFDDDNFSLSDFTSQPWNIDAKKAIMRNDIKINIGENIKIIGEKIDDGIFQALEIRPWGSKCVASRCRMIFIDKATNTGMQR